MTDDERWARYVTFPALVLSLPFYVVSTAYYVACRKSFGLFLDFIDNCPLLPDLKIPDEEAA